MPYSIRDSNRAYIEYEEILGYVLNKFGFEVVVKVDTYFENVIGNIAIPSL